MGKPNGWRTIFTSFVILAATTVAAPAQTFKTLVSFDGSDGVNPMYAPLVQGRDRKFYGTTRGGGGNLPGTVFKVTAGGKLTPLADVGLDQPYAGLVLATNGWFYGTTAQGGAYSWGTIFKMTPNGTLRPLYSFCAQQNCSDGVFPIFGLVQVSNGSFYGTTPAAAAVGNPGTAFAFTPADKFILRHTFNGVDGASSGPLIQANDGNLYGVGSGGAHGYGTVFEMTTRGKITILHSFDLTDGATPSGPLVQATDGNFYGTTQQGGANNNCAYGCGTVFKLTPKGALKTLYTFCSQTNCTDGAVPQAGLLQATNGIFYGVTTGGGTSGAGTVFSLSTGLGPFVTFVQRAAEVGQTAEILGQRLTGTTKVAFNGTSTKEFTVKTDTFLTATVPAGATTGYVTVTTPKGRLTSNVPFRVIP